MNTETQQQSVMMVVSAGVIAGLFLLAVTIAGWTVHTAYRSAHWQQREATALAREKELREELSQAKSLKVALSYAQQHGFEAGQIAGVIDAAQPVAQNISVR